MGRFQVNGRGAIVLERGFPARDANAPFIAGLQSGKSPLRNRRHQIVPVENRKIQKLARGLHAHRVLTDIFRPGAAVTVAIKSCHRIATTAAKLSAKNIRRHK